MRVPLDGRTHPRRRPARVTTLCLLQNSFLSKAVTSFAKLETNVVARWARTACRHPTDGDCELAGSDLVVLLPVWWMRGEAILHGLQAGIEFLLN